MKIDTTLPILDIQQIQLIVLLCAVRTFDNASQCFVHYIVY